MQQHVFFVLVFFFFLCPFAVDAVSVEERLSGRILLQVEENGEAWYVSPKNNLRYFLGRPSDAFNLMRELGQGISNKDLEKIPVDRNFTRKHLGKIFLQVEKNGEAWYVNPTDEKKYFLGHPNDAFNLMRNLGLGISNDNLLKINSINQTQEDLNELKFFIHDEVNKERITFGLKPLEWNHEVALVAGIQSNSLALENKNFTGFGKACDYPMIHHENLNEGLYNSDRLKNNSIFYYSQAGENIALYSAASFKVSFLKDDSIYNEFQICEKERSELENSFKKRINEAESENEKRDILINEINTRKKLFQEKSSVKVIDLNWYDKEFLAKEIVKGWMQSQGHRENILHEDYDEAGIGVSIENFYVYVTQVFIKGAECGYKNGECCTKKGYLPYCFVPLECINNICL